MRKVLIAFLVALIASPAFAAITKHNQYYFGTAAEWTSAGTPGVLLGVNTDSNCIFKGNGTTSFADIMSTGGCVPLAVSGTASTLITGTAGTNGNCVEWDANGGIVDAGAACGVGSVTQLSDLSDVGDTTPTDGNVLIADGDSWESRAILEADISDFGTYLTDVAGDTTPQAAGNFDIQGFTITTSTTNGDIVLVPNGTGAISTTVSSYETHVTGDNDIPNKKYVDDAITAGGGYTDEDAQDTIGTALTDTEFVRFVYTDAAGTIEAYNDVLVEGTPNAVTTSWTPDLSDVARDVATATGPNTLVIATPSASNAVSGREPGYSLQVNATGGPVILDVSAFSFETPTLDPSGWTIAAGESMLLDVWTIDGGTTWYMDGPEDLSKRPTTTIASNDIIPCQDVSGTPDTVCQTTAQAIANTADAWEPADATLLRTTDVDNTPVNGVTDAPVSSNWAYDHENNTSNPHSVTAAQVGAATTATKLDDFATPDDNTDLNATSSAHGLLPKLSNVATEFLDGQGGWTALDSTMVTLTGRTITSSGSIAASDLGTMITCNSATPITIDVDTDTITWSASSWVLIKNIGAGTCTIQDGTTADVTPRVQSGGSLAFEQYGGGSIVGIDDDEVQVTGGGAIGGSGTDITVTEGASNATIASSTGSDDVIELATGSLAGLESPAHYTRIESVEDGADVTDAANVDAAGAVMEADYDAQTILAATSDDTPAAIVIAENDLIGRLPSGNIAGIADGDLTEEPAPEAGDFLLCWVGNVLRKCDVGDLPVSAGDVTAANSPNAGEFAAWTSTSSIEGLTESEFKAAANLEIGTDVQAYADNLTSWAALAPGTATGTGNVVFSASPTFTGTPILPATITLGANGFTRSGAHSLTLTTTDNSSVTLPTSGTLYAVGGNAGEPSAIVLTNGTGLPQSGTTNLTTASSPQFTAVNIGDATDTTVARSAAGRITVEGKRLSYLGTTTAETGTSHTLAAGDDVLFLSWTNSGAKTYTIATGTAAANDEWTGCNNGGTGDLTVVQGSGMTLIGNLIFHPGECYLIKFTSTTTANVIGGASS